MRIPLCLVLFVALCGSVIGQIAPVKPGKLSSTQLLSVKRLIPTSPDQAPDGLVLCFLVSQKPPAQHKFALKELRDFQVQGQSYRQVTETKLGRVFTPNTTVHDASKYAADHPEVATAAAAADPKSLIITTAIGGASLTEKQEVEIRFRLGFGKTAAAPESEELIFRLLVPSP